MKNAVIYIKYDDTKRYKEDDFLDVQFNTCNQYAIDNNINIVKVYGDLENRFKFQSNSINLFNMFTDVALGYLVFDIVLIYNYDSFIECFDTSIDGWLEHFEEENVKVIETK